MLPSCTMARKEWSRLQQGCSILLIFQLLGFHLLATSFMRCEPYAFSDQTQGFMLQLEYPPVVMSFMPIRIEQLFLGGDLHLQGKQGTNLEILLFK